MSDQTNPDFSKYKTKGNRTEINHRCHVVTLNFIQVSPTHFLFLSYHQLNESVEKEKGSDSSWPHCQFVYLGL